MSKITIETIKHSFGIQTEVKSEVKGNIIEFIAVMTALDSLRNKLIEDVKKKLTKDKKDGVDMSTDYQAMIDKLIKGK